MDNTLIVMLIIMAIAGLSNWLQRKAQAAEQATEEEEQQSPPTMAPPPRPGQPPPRWSPDAPQPRTRTLEGELRRLFEPEVPTSLPPAVPPSRSAQPQPPPLHSPATGSRPAPASSRQQTIPSLAPAELATSVEDRLRQVRELKAEQEHRLRELRSITRSARKSVPAKTETATALPATASIFAMTRSPQAARQAFVASLIFGAPKGFES
jgi:hypothetical protein